MTFKDYLGLNKANFQAGMVHGCGCGKKAARPSVNRGVTVARTITGGTKVENAKTFQSATMRKAPQAPVNRKTV